jgi:hypothetical protein
MAYDPVQRSRRLNTLLAQGIFRNAAILIALGIGLTVLVVMHQTLGQVPLPGQLTWAGWLTLLVTLGAFLLNALTRLPAEAVFLGALAVLLLSGVLDTATALERV